MARPKKNKHPRLRNGFGSVRYLGKNRTNPYAVLAPTKTYTLCHNCFSRRLLFLLSLSLLVYCYALTSQNRKIFDSTPILSNILWICFLNQPHKMYIQHQTKKTPPVLLLYRINIVCLSIILNQTYLLW